MNKKIFKLSLVASLLLGVAFLQSAHAQAVDHSMHGGAAPAADPAPAAPAATETPTPSEDHSMHGGAAHAANEDDGMGDGGSGGHGKHHNKKQHIVVKLDHFDAVNWEDPFPGGHNWQPVCMAFGIANRVLSEKNHVTLFLNLQGVELADTDNGSDLSSFACLNGNLQEGWDNLVNKGVEIAVCSGCAEIGGITEETLREGAYLTTMDDVSRIFLNADKVIDY